MIWECLSPDILLRRLLFRLPGTDRRIRIVNGLFFSGLPSLLFFRNKRTFVTVTIWYLQYNLGRVFCKQLWSSQLKLNPRKHVRLRGSIIFYKKRMEAMGLEPMTSRVWGERSSRLSYASISVIIALCQQNARYENKGKSKFGNNCVKSLTFKIIFRKLYLQNKEMRVEYHLNWTFFY